jgi:hypothetical protein
MLEDLDNAGLFIDGEEKEGILFKLLLLLRAGSRDRG